jgi:peptidoglycan/LPS O-acetylase OafA/YrhL
MTIKGLNGIRALAVIAVVWHHTHPGFFLPSSHRGFLGVDVFFVLSGFLITTLLLEEHLQKGRISLRHFYLRRSLRIFPLYYAVLLLLALQALVTRSAQGRMFLDELPFHLSYLSNWVQTHSMMSITWSLSTEEQFYLLWPPLLAWLGWQARWPLGIVLGLNLMVLLGVADAWVGRQGLQLDALSIWHVTFTPILIGVFLAFGLHRRRPPFRISGALMLAAFLVIANIPGDFGGWPRLAFHLATAGLLAAMVLNQESTLVRLLEWRPLNYLGSISYGIYLLHKVPMAVAHRVMSALQLDNPFVYFAITLAGTVVLAALSFRYLERPCLKLKERFREPGVERPDASGAMVR